MARGFLFNLNTCTGCHACRLACEVENGLPWGESWRNVHGFNLENNPALPLFHLSLACNHCDDAPCMSACPALAYRRDDATGAVLIDENRCIGCKYCSWACPFDAPLYAPKTGVMTKCTLCTPRLETGRDPACVSYCPTGALGFGELDGVEPSEKRRPSPRERMVPGFTDHGIGPRIRFTPLREERWALGEAKPSPSTQRTRRLSLAAEWPLLVFTLLAAVAVSVPAAAEFAEKPVSLWAWLIPATAGMAVSLLHLGKKSRAWRAVLNLRRSWVSREVFAFSAFVALGIVASPAGGGVTPLQWPAVVVGFLALWAMDRVYHTTRARGQDPVHSAEVLDTGLYLAGWLAGWPLLAGVIGLYKAVLYLRRKILAARAGESWRPWGSTLRVVFGFAVPLGLALDRPDGWEVGAFAAALAGEIIDRIEFYRSFRMASPGAELEAEYGRRVENGQRHSPGV